MSVGSKHGYWWAGVFELAVAATLVGCGVSHDGLAGQAAPGENEAVMTSGPGGTPDAGRDVAPPKPSGTSGGSGGSGGAGGSPVPDAGARLDTSAGGPPGTGGAGGGGGEMGMGSSGWVGQHAI